MWLFQNSQYQEDFWQFLDSIFSPVSSKHCRASHLFEKSQNFLHTTPFPALMENHKNKSCFSTLTNTCSNSSHKSGSFTYTDSFLHDLYPRSLQRKHKAISHPAAEWKGLELLPCHPVDRWEPQKSLCRPQVPADACLLLICIDHLGLKKRDP